MPTADTVATELDQAHERARSAYRARDLGAYVSGFAPDLVYRDTKGRTYSREQIGRQMQDQFERVVAVDTRFDRESLTLDGTNAVEIGTQTARVGVRIALAFARRWRIHRRGKFTWRRTPDGWVISAVDVFEERVSGDGFSRASLDMFNGGAV